MKGTGDCFPVAGRIVLDGDDGLRLVHGIATGQGPIDGVRHWHAWVERTDHLPLPDGRSTHIEMVIDRSNGKEIEMPVVLYYRFGQITDVRTYTREQAAVLMVRHKHWGPWHEE